jgi:hypothetical protein
LQKIKERRLDRAGICVNKNATSVLGIFSFLGAIGYKVCTERVCGFGLVYQGPAQQTRSCSRTRNGPMRFLVAAVAMAMLASTALGQDASGTGGGMGGKGGKGRHAQQDTEKSKADNDRQKAADEAYKAALRRIPDPKEKYDPWRNIR